MSPGPAHLPEKVHGCSSTGYDLRYQKWSGVKLERDPTKRGEIETVKDMLDNPELKGAVVVLDVLHYCQREILDKISEKKACVVVQLKKNQPNLYQTVQSQFQILFDAQKEKIIIS